MIVAGSEGQTQRLYHSILPRTDGILRIEHVFEALVVDMGQRLTL